MMHSSVDALRGTSQPWLRSGTAWISALLLIVLGLGCGGSGTEQTILRVAINAGPEGGAIKQLAGAYKDARIEIVELPYDALREQLVTRLASSDPTFDVVMIDDPWFPEFAPHLKALTTVPQTLRDDIVPASLSLGCYPYKTGELRALPFVGNTQLLFIRRDMLPASTGLPKTWDEVVTLASEITGHGRYGYAIRGRAGAPIVTDFLPVYWSLGGKLSDNGASPRLEAVDSLLFLKALRLYKRLETASPPGAANFDWSEMTAAFSNGQAAMELNWPAAIPKVREVLGNPGPTGKWDLVTPPGSEGREGTSMIGNWLVGIPGNSKAGIAAERYLVWLMDQQQNVAGDGNPPTRISVYNQLASKSGSDYFTTIRKALELSTARDRTPKWSQIEVAVSRAVSEYIAGSTDERRAVTNLRQELHRVFASN